MARHSGYRGQRATKRHTDWGFGPDMLNVAMSSSTKVIGTTSLTIGEQQTVVRLRGLIHVNLLTATAAGDGFFGATGIAIVNTDAFNVGVTAIPGPFTDANWDAWIWHSFFDVRAVTATIADGVNANAVSQRIEVDSKAMRRWDPADTMVWLVEGTESGTASCEFNGDSRILLKSA